MIGLKRVYDSVSRADGTRFMVERRRLARYTSGVSVKIALCATTLTFDEEPEDFIGCFCPQGFAEVPHRFPDEQRPVRVRPADISKHGRDSVRFSEVLQRKARRDDVVALADNWRPQNKAQGLRHKAQDQ